MHVRTSSRYKFPQYNTFVLSVLWDSLIADRRSFINQFTNRTFNLHFKAADTATNVLFTRNQ